MIGGAGAPLIDLYTVNDSVTVFDGTTQGTPNTSIVGKTSKSAAITGGEKTGIFIVDGQSLACNGLPTPYTATNAKAHHLNIYDGVCYDAKDPLIGTTGPNGNFITMLADKLINAGTFTRVILIPIAIPGSSMADHAPGGMLNQRVRIAYLRARGLGWIGNVDVRFGILWCQGESDNNPLSTSQASYEASWAAYQASIDGLGYTGKYFVAKETMLSNVVSSTIQAAQAAVVDNVRVFAGANTDSLTGGTNRTDGTHLTDVGGDANAALWATVLAAQYP